MSEGVGRGRPKKWANDAERMKAKRAERKAEGNPIPSGSNTSRTKTHDQSKFTNGMFIGIDGEGESYGEVETFQSENGEYEAMRHRYTLLSASTGEYVWQAGKRLTTEQCLEFLVDLSIEYKDAIFVIFAGGYDCNHMLFQGLPRSQLQTLHKEGQVLWTGERYAYEIEYRPRKSLVLRRFPRSGIEWESTDKGGWRKAKPLAKMTLWDVWGFFQGSFVATVAKWLGKDTPGLADMAAMKAARSDFVNRSHQEVLDYNKREVELLAQLMDKVREALTALDLTVSRWDGAGAVAAAMNQKHKVKEFKGNTPAEVFDAARCAYSGGHIELMKIGNYKGPIYHYDVNSAYPSEYVNLPSLAGGQWIHGEGELPLPGFTVVRIKWNFPRPMPFYPLFWRDDQGTITYPSLGEGWYWFPEYETAQLFADKFGDWIEKDTLIERHTFEVVEWWHYQPLDNVGPFNWVREYYAKRQAYVQAEKAGELTTDTQWMKGAEKVIKLGLNSLYGKTAQQVGYRLVNGEVIPPPYFQLEWAGYVTSGCRAKLMGAALEAPHDIVFFATDAILSTVPLSVNAPKEKTLGLWEASEHHSLVTVASGVYWPDDDAFSRGFDKESMKSAHPIIKAWKAKQDHVVMPQQRLIGIGSAVSANIWWAMRGRFVQSGRVLRIDGHSGKRYSINQRTAKPWLRFENTSPRENVRAGVMSYPYKIAWIDDEGVEEIDAESNMREHGEEQDAAEYFDEIGFGDD